MNGQKFDSEKIRFSLIPKGTLQPVIRVLEFGAKKYAVDNWRKVENANVRYFDAAHRHLDAWWNGESTDSETNESHLAHAICCLMFLLAMEDQSEKISTSEIKPSEQRICYCPQWRGSSFFQGEYFTCKDCGGQAAI